MKQGVEECDESDAPHKTEPRDDALLQNPAKKELFDDRCDPDVDDEGLGDRPGIVQIDAEPGRLGSRRVVLLGSLGLECVSTQRIDLEPLFDFRSGR